MDESVYGSRVCVIGRRIECAGQRVWNNGGGRYVFSFDTIQVFFFKDFTLNFIVAAFCIHALLIAHAVSD